jgi:hypothetical protein
LLKKKPDDHIVHDCPYSKEMREILNVSEYSKMGLAIGVDLVPIASIARTFTIDFIWK